MPRVFDFINYREFLRAYFDFKKATHPHYSASAFARKAGLTQSSRGYLKLVVDGKRNLTPHTVRSFAEAMSLNPAESLFFESLVYFNQAKNAKDQDYYFHRLSMAAQGNDSKPFEVLKANYSYYTHWYLVAIRELVGLATFQEDAAWIAGQLRGKVTRAQATEALQQLESMGLIRRDDAGKLVQAQALTKFPGGYFNSVTHKFHLEMIDRAREALTEDPYEERNASAITLSCDRDKYPEILRMINEFRHQLNLRFGTDSCSPDTVFQVCFQLFQLTKLKDPKALKKEGEVLS